MGLVGSLRAAGIHHIVGPDNQGDVGFPESIVDLIHLVEPVIGDVGFSEKDVHVTWHPAGHRMDRIADLAAVLLDQLGEFTDLVLRLGNCQAVARDDDD